MYGMAEPDQDPYGDDTREKDHRWSRDGGPEGMDVLRTLGLPVYHVQRIRRYGAEGGLGIEAVRARAAGSGAYICRHEVSVTLWKVSKS